MTEEKPEQVEGNILSMDPANKFLILADRTGQPFLKVYWKPQHEAKAQQQKVGYFEAFAVEMEEPSGGLREATLIDFVYKPRGDFPKLPRSAKSGGGYQQQPRNDRAIMLQVCFKEASETARHHLLDLSDTLNEAELDRVMDWAVQRAVKDANTLMASAASGMVSSGEEREGKKEG